MGRWGTNSGGNAASTNTEPDARRRSHGVQAGIVFGTVALVVVAACLIAMLIMRNEQRKLEDRVLERDSEIKGMQGKVDGANRERATAVTEAKQASAMVESFKVARVREDEEWKRRLEEMTRERDELQDVADKVKDESERLESDAKQSLKRSAVPNLPPRPKGPLVGSSTVFVKSPIVKLGGGIPGLTKGDVEAAAAEAMLERKVALSPTGAGDALIQLRCMSRVVAATPRQLTSVALTIELQQVHVSTDLANLVWVSTLVDSDLVVSADDAKTAEMVKSKAKELTARLLDQAYGSPAPATASGTGTSSPANPAPAPASGNPTTGNPAPGGATPHAPGNPSQPPPNPGRPPKP